MIDVRLQFTASCLDLVAEDALLRRVLVGPLHGSLASRSGHQHIGRLVSTCVFALLNALQLVAVNQPSLSLLLACHALVCLVICGVVHIFGGHWKGSLFAERSMLQQSEACAFHRHYSGLAEGPCLPFGVGPGCASSVEKTLDTRR